MRLALFRAAPDAARTAARLAEKGHDSVVAPVIVIRHADVRIDPMVDALVFSSQHAIAAAARSPDLPQLRHRPCFCVGDRTAAEAVEAGFRDVRPGEGDGAALATRIAQNMPPGAHLSYLAGRDRKPALETALHLHGFAVTVREAYEARTAPPWPSAVSRALASCDGALHYSRRSAALAVEQARGCDLLPRMWGWTHYCLSADIAEEVRSHAIEDVRCAGAPDETHLLALL